MKLKALLVAAVLQVCCFSENTIIYLISPPRSLSTAFLRCMEARGDFTIFHEPSLFLERNIDLPLSLAYNKEAYPPFALGHEKRKPSRQKTYKSYDAMKEEILEAAKTSNVFVKEISHSLANYIASDFELMQKPNVYFFFLIRDPHATMLSYYKKLNAHSPRNKLEIDYQVTYELFQVISEHAAHKPLVFFSEDFAKNPQSVMQTLCSYSGIEFKENAFSWVSHDKKFSGDTWHEGKPKKGFRFWHDRALNTKGLGPITTYDKDANGAPTFSEIADKWTRNEYQQIYKHNLEIYALFKQ